MCIGRKFKKGRRRVLCASISGEGRLRWGQQTLSLRSVSLSLSVMVMRVEPGSMVVLMMRRGKVSSGALTRLKGEMNNAQL